MKKILCIIIVALIVTLAGCGGTDEYGLPKPVKTIRGVEIYKHKEKKVDLDEIDFYSDLNDIGFSKSEKPIRTSRYAVSVGELILEKYQQQGYMKGQVLLSVGHSKKDNRWYFTYTIGREEDELREPIEGGLFCVAIDGDTGNVLKAWILE